MAFQHRIKARNAAEDAKFNRVSELFDKRKNNVAKDLLDIQATRRLFEASKKTANESKQRSRTKSLDEMHQWTVSSKNTEEKLPKLSDSKKMTRRISLPSNHKFGMSRNDDTSSKFVQKLEGIQERDKDSLKLPVIKSKSTLDLSNTKDFSPSGKVRSMESLRANCPVAKSPVANSPGSNSPGAISRRAKSPMAKSPGSNSPGAISPKAKSPVTSKKQRRHSADVNDNLPPTPQIVCHDANGNETCCKAIQKQRRERALVELERLSRSTNELDQLMAGKFKRIGEGSLGESYLRSKRVQSYESGIDMKEDEQDSSRDVTQRRQLDHMGNRLNIPLSATKRTDSNRSTESIYRQETLRSKSCTALDGID
ncbi:uncharacterized protein LOC110248356 [Exaiptasia diaphana]|uniref:Uncharacterized protein n=1 Tax=Exaiptasia diaphana TaxID=2652724 RepID=A0A913XUK8_EXADI|nr:uncharacterized protein LOC110248356 [Exaiptasia diaphana]KXJ24348.1 Neurofilament medium polypeptide [Exaiptasia diaphana]